MATRTRRWASRGLRLALYLVVGLAVLLALLFVALRTSFAREQVRVRVNDALSEVFQGRLQLDHIGAITLSGVREVDARVFDANGRQVARVQGLRADVSLPSLAWQLITNSAEPNLVLARVRVEHADVTLRDDPELGVSLAGAFLPRTPTVEPPGAPPSGPHLRVESLELGHVWAHGQLAGSPVLDAELKKVGGVLRQTPQDGFSLDLNGADLVTRGLPGGADPGGHVTGKIVAPADVSKPLRLEATLKGHAAGSPLDLDASWVGDDLGAVVDLPALPAAFVNERVPQLRLDGNVALHATVSGALPMLSFATTIDGAAAHVDLYGYAAVAEGVEAAATVEASRIDAASIVADAPKSDLYVRLDAFAFEDGDGDYVVAQRIALAPGQVAGNATPPLWVNGKGRIDADGALSAAGQVAADDPGLSLHGRYQVTLPSGPGGVVRAEVQAQLSDPARLTQLGVRAAGKLDASGELRLQDRTLNGKASLSLSHVDHAVVQARNVELAARASGTLEQPRLRGGVTLDVLSGRAHADVDYAPTHQELELFVSNIDLLRFSNILGSKLPLEQATLGLKARVTREASSAHYALNANAKVDMGKVGSTQLTAIDFQLPTTVPPRSQWANLQGQLVVNGNVQLEALSPLLTRAGVPIERTTGTVRFEVATKHTPKDPQGLELSVALDTNGLRVIQQREPPRAIETTADAVANQPLALEGIDLHFSAHAHPRTGETYGTLILRDPAGTLANIAAATQLPDTWPNGFAGASSLARLPLKVRLEVTRRKLATLPALLRPAGLRGRISLDASFEGTVMEPQLEAKLSGESVRAAGTKEPINVEASVRYTPERGDCQVDAKLARQASTNVARVKADWQGDLRRVGMLAGGESGLSGSAEAELTELPLETLPVIADRQVTGRVSGKLALKDWGRDARVDATFDSTTLSVGKMPIRELKVSAKTSADQILADVAVKSGGGTAHASLGSTMRWGKRPLPELTRDGTAKLDTRAFDLSTLSPLLAGSVSEIGGLLDAQTQLVVTPTTTQLSGSAKLEKGVLQLPAIGQRFSEISASVAVAGQKLKVENLTARGLTGRINANASASLDGFDLRGAEAHVRIDKNEALPLTLEGAALGDIWGNIDAAFASPASGARKLDIDVPTFHLIMPDTSGYDLQSLDVPEDVRVGVRRADGTFTPLPVQPLTPGSPTASAQAPATPLNIRVRLGKDVVVERGTTAQVQLGGELQIASAAETTVDGRIEIRGGKLDVSGKKFDIERGVVTFQGDDPGNPTITATARWDAPEYTVYADYVGDVKTGRIKLRSEPPLSPSEIANLLLFGSPEGSAGGSADPNTAALAVGLAGDTAAKGLNQALDDFTNLDVSARIDTTTGSARPELVFQVSPRVSARVTRAIGAPSAGEAPDRTFLTLEFRIKRAWALSAVFGDHGGSALDLIWRRRY